MNPIHQLGRVWKRLFGTRELKIIILYTTDLHGFVYPYDYILSKDVDWGLARVATLVEEYRKRYPHVLLLDNGDFLQGSPLTYYYNFLVKRGSHPLARIMNKMGYEASCVGNHDIEQGPAVYNRVRRQLKFPWLSANAKTRRKQSYFQPYTIREIEGVRIAILGLTTPAIPMWLNPELYPGIKWQDMVQSARGWLPFLKEQKKADIVVGLFHAGIHPHADKPGWPEQIPEENPCLQIAQEMPGYDIIFTGHEHRLYNSHPEGTPSEETSKPLVMMAGSHGRHLGVVELTFTRQQNRWVLKEKKGMIESTRGVEPHPEIIKLAQPYHRKIMHYINSRIGHAEEDISSRYSRLMDGGFVDLIHRTQFHFTTADISLAASFTTTFVLKKGPIRIKDVYGLYKYENYLYLIILTGQQIKDHLEWSSQYFNTIDPEKPFATPLINHDFMGFNYDMAEGIRYEINITRPVGERIQNLTLPDGNPFDLQKTYKVAVNSYRARQLYLRFKCRTIWRSNKEIRDLLVEYIKAKKVIRDKTTRNWKIVPEWVIEKYIQQNRHTSSRDSFGEED